MDNTSDIDCQRSDGSVARQRFTMESSAAGTSGRIAEIGGGLVVTVRAAGSRTGKAYLRVTISYMTAPKAKTSVRASVALPPSCSGAIYPRVPGNRLPAPLIFDSAASPDGASG